MLAYYQKYSPILMSQLDRWYRDAGLDETVVAYRSLGKSNYHFAKRVQEYVREHESITVMCFDVTGFFDNLDHKIIKDRLKWILGVTELSDDWYKVFRFVTRYRFIDKFALKDHPVFGPRMKAKGSSPIATIADLVDAGIKINQNTCKFGIPQGTPISASISNLYMADFDQQLKAEADARGALYQRYSDDILVACPPEDADEMEEIVLKALSAALLKIQPAKTERRCLVGDERLSFQYLGYQLGFDHARLRSGSISKQWRSLKRAMRRAERKGSAMILHSKTTKIYTRKLRSKYTHVGIRNFISYTGRSADVLGGAVIKRQTKKLHKFALASIDHIKTL